MTKCINADALIEELKRRDFLPVIVKQAIEAVPAADVVEVVRCRECKHRDFIGKWPLRSYFCRHPLGLKAIMHETDFCSYGEKEERHE